MLTAIVFLLATMANNVTNWDTQERIAVVGTPR